MRESFGRPPRGRRGTDRVGRVRPVNTSAVSLKES
jgi:hypothetical protein